MEFGYRQTQKQTLNIHFAEGLNILDNFIRF